MQKFKVLVIDDEIGRGREKESFEALHADPEIEYLFEHEGNKALETIASIPDLALVLLDIVFLNEQPQIDGDQILKAIKKQYPDLPVIMFTQLDTKEDFLRASELRNLGAFDYVIKEQPPVRILSRIKSALRVVRAERAIAATRNKLIESNIKAFLDVLDENQFDAYRYGEFIGHSEIMRRYVFDMIPIACQDDSTRKISPYW